MHVQPIACAPARCLHTALVLYCYVNPRVLQRRQPLLQSMSMRAGAGGAAKHARSNNGHMAKPATAKPHSLAKQACLCSGASKHGVLARHGRTSRPCFCRAPRPSPLLRPWSHAASLLRLTALHSLVLRRRVTPEQIQESVDRSLARLGTDYIDLLQIHWPDRECASCCPVSQTHAVHRHSCCPVSQRHRCCPVTRRREARKHS